MSEGKVIIEFYNKKDVQKISKKKSISYWTWYNGYRWRI
jgi:hypothetical protein